MPGYLDMRKGLGAADHFHAISVNINTDHLLQSRSASRREISIQVSGRVLAPDIF